MPRVATSLSRCDRLGTIGARSGLTRNNYKVTPGLYCVGKPAETTPVLVTANYKLTF
ncbi:MAG: CO dehydrogenase/acetyl-CoA synthase gamma subunit (Corrinoid Fe-S protein)-like protein, partial [uncultured bacterium]